MEYSTSPEFTGATVCTGTEITGLKAGTYYVRIAETATTKAGAYAVVVVKEHVHTYAEEWSKDENTHWHAAVCGHTQLKEDEAAHRYVNYEYNGDATYAKDGTETGTCECKATDTRVKTGSKLVDDTAPEAKITVKTRMWESILNKVTFGLFYKNEQEVTVEAEDTQSGINTVEYYISTVSMTEELESFNGWITYKDESRPRLEKGNMLSMPR